MCVAPVLTYGIPTWTLASKLTKKNRNYAEFYDEINIGNKTQRSN